MPGFAEIGYAVDNQAHGQDGLHIDQEQGVIAVFDGISSKNWEAQQTAVRFAELLKEGFEVREAIGALIREQKHESTATVAQLKDHRVLEYISIGDSPLFITEEAGLVRANELDTLFTVLFWPYLHGKLQGKDAVELTFEELWKALAFSTIPDTLERKVQATLLEEREHGIHCLRSMQYLLGTFVGMDVSSINETVKDAREEQHKYKKSPTLLAHIALRSRDVLTRCLSHTQAEEAMKVKRIILDDDDILLLSTDGLTKNLYRHEIYHVLRKADSLQAAAEKLIKKAKKRRAVVDDITVALAKLPESGTLAA